MLVTGATMEEPPISELYLVLTLTDTTPFLTSDGNMAYRAQPDTRTILFQEPCQEVQQ